AGFHSAAGAYPQGGLVGGAFFASLSLSLQRNEAAGRRNRSLIEKTIIQN
ncbi:MAG: hypothetical protein ACJAWL_002133, partial [Motiliproteus sp.]